MLFFFSGTGNTRWAAETISKITGETLLSIPDELRKGDCRYTLAEGERLGFCFPVHGWQPPRIVREFIRKMTVSNAGGHYCFALCTCGDTVGDTMTILNKELARHGLEATGQFSIVMPESYVCLPFMYTDTEEREREKIDAAGKLLKEIGRMIVSREADTATLVKGATPRLYSYVIGRYFNSRMITDKPFTVSDECIKCGLCAEVCPTGDITGGRGSSPEWKHDGSCTCCLACYHHCPVHAINYGKRTKKRGQYYFRKNRDGGNT